MLNNSEFRILIIDDEMFNIEVVQGFLEEEGYTLSFNTNPKKALERIFQEEFDLILLDINMPQMNGLELAKKIKNDEATKDIPIIFLSAYSDTKIITDAFSSGAVDYLTKPFNGLELIARVHTHIQLRHYIKELQVKQEKLAQIASTDPLTSLPNRLRFLSIIKKQSSLITEDPSRLSLVYIKIDQSEKTNIIHGYKKTDKAILALSELIKNNIRENFTFARIFGSEFALLMPNTSLESATNTAKKLLMLIRKNETKLLHMTCSFGVGEYKHNENFEAFILRVDKLMQKVHDAGGNMIA